MSYKRANKPIFYVNHFYFGRARGIHAATLLDVNGVNSDNDYKLIDGNVQDVATFSCDGDSDDIYININIGSAAIDTNTIAILHHNLTAAGAVVQLHYDTAVMSSSNTGTAFTNMAAAIGCSTGSSPWSTITPTSGYADLIATSSITKTNQYIAIVISPAGSTYTDDITIGQVFIGDYYLMPNTGDLSVNRGYMYDAVTTHEARGGKRYTFGSWLTDGDNQDNYHPFGETNYMQHAGGREYLEMSWSYIDDDDLFESDTRDLGTHMDTISKVWWRVSGPYSPFIFCPDSTSTTVGDYMFARFAQDELKSTQQAHRSWGINTIRIEQEF